MTTRESMDDYIARLGITMTTTRIPASPIPDAWRDDDKMRHFCCILSRPNTATQRPATWKLSIFFSQGCAHKKPPKAPDVLDCIRADSHGSDQPFEEWAVDLGYEPDSRKHERIYNNVREQTARAKRFLGPHFKELLEIEPL